MTMQAKFDGLAAQETTRPLRTRMPGHRAVIAAGSTYALPAQSAR
jgi:hypothetical protein